MWLQYALDKDKNLVSVHDCPRGRSNIRCPYCQGELTAKKGKVRASHFAHVNETCISVKTQKFDSVSLPFYDRFDLGLKPRYLKEMLENYDKGYRRILNASELSELGITEYNGYAANGRGAWQYTKLGKMALGDLSLMLFDRLQEPKIRKKLESIEKSILNTKDWLASPQSKLPIFQHAIPKNIQKLQDKITNYQIYLLQYRRMLSNSLYFLEIKADEGYYYKIGVTTRSIEQRISEIERDLKQHFKSVSIKGLGFWQHRGNVEYYFKYRYRKFNYRIGSLTEYFKFDDVKPVLRDLRRMKPKQLNAPQSGSLRDREKEILENKPFDKVLLSLYIRYGMQKSKEENIHIGRPSGETESIKKFLAKPKNKAIARYLKKGLSLRQTVKQTRASINTVRKVKAALNNELRAKQ